LVEKIVGNTKEIQIIHEKFIKLLINKFDNIKLTKRIENWFKYSFSDLLKELKKQRIKLSLNEESEWLDFFESKIKKHTEFSNIQKALEYKMNNTVYELYSLSEKEMKIVEESD